MSKSAVMKMRGPHAGRTMLVDVHEDGPFPRCVKLDVRPAESAPTGTRVKYALTASFGRDGKVKPLPVAKATIGAPGLVIESRLEMN